MADTYDVHAEVIDDGFDDFEEGQTRREDVKSYRRIRDDVGEIYGLALEKIKDTMRETRSAKDISALINSARSIRQDAAEIEREKNGSVSKVLNPQQQQKMLDDYLRSQGWQPIEAPQPHKVEHPAPE